MALNGQTNHNSCNNRNTFESAQIYLYIPREVLNLMLFYTGGDQRIIIVEDSSWLEIRSKYNQFIMAVCVNSKQTQLIFIHADTCIEESKN